jgi:DNA repair exonuclease SbcCD ATPase subunit
MDQRQSVRDLILKLQAPGSSPASIQPDSTTQPTAPSAQVPDLSSAVQDVADALRTLSAGQAQDASSNQELTRYIASAQETLNATRQLTDSLLQRHHERLAELTQLQQRLTERAELRRTRTLETDQTYQQLKLDLESAHRRLLAAEQSGLADEAAEARGEIDSLTLLIDSRAQLYAPDPGDARSIAQVAQLIEQSRTAMAEDQARADAALSELRTRLMQLAPRQDGITPQQRRSLADIEQRLDNLKLAGQSALLASQQAAKIQQQLAQAYATLADLEARIAHRLENLQNAKP